MKPLILLAASASMCTAALIDDFTSGTAPTAYAFDTNLFESGGVILGAERDVNIDVIVGTNTYGISAGAATFASPNGPLVFQYDGLDSSNTVDRSNLNIDLTDGLGFDRFLIEISSYAATVNQTLTATIFGPGPADQIAGTFLFNSTGILEAPFAALTSISGAGASPTSARALSFRFSNLVNPGGVSIDAICTGSTGGNCSSSTPIPEPSTVLLTGLALTALALQRRRR